MSNFPTVCPITSIESQWNTYHTLLRPSDGLDQTHSNDQQSSSTVSPPTTSHSTMRPAPTFDKKVEDMKPTKRCVALSYTLESLLETYNCDE